MFLKEFPFSEKESVSKDSFVRCGDDMRSQLALENGEEGHKWAHETNTGKKRGRAAEDNSEMECEGRIVNWGSQAPPIFSEQTQEPEKEKYALAQSAGRTKMEDLISDGDTDSDEEFDEICRFPPCSPEFDRQRTVMLTWSHTPSGPAPHSCAKKGFARVILSAIYAQDPEAGDKGPSVIVVQERHKCGAPHYHAVVHFGKKARAGVWKKIVDHIAQDRGIKVHARMARGTQPMLTLLKYLMLPSDKKPGVDETPFLTNGFCVPQSIIDLRLKSKMRLEKKPASADDVNNFIRTRNISSHKDFEQKLNANVEDSVDEKRLEK